MTLQPRDFVNWLFIPMSIFTCFTNLDIYNQNSRPEGLKGDQIALCGKPQRNWGIQSVIMQSSPQPEFLWDRWYSLVTDRPPVSKMTLLRVSIHTKSRVDCYYYLISRLTIMVARHPISRLPIPFWRAANSFRPSCARIDWSSWWPQWNAFN